MSLTFRNCSALPAVALVVPKVQKTTSIPWNVSFASVARLSRLIKCSLSFVLSTSCMRLTILSIDREDQILTVSYKNIELVRFLSIAPDFAAKWDIWSNLDLILQIVGYLRSDRSVWIWVSSWKRGDTCILHSLNESWRRQCSVSADLGKDSVNSLGKEAEKGIENSRLWRLCIDRTKKKVGPCILEADPRFFWRYW